MNSSIILFIPSLHRVHTSTSFYRETADGLIKQSFETLRVEAPLHHDVEIQRGVAICRGLRSLQAHDLPFLHPSRRRTIFVFYFS